MYTVGFGDTVDFGTALLIPDNPPPGSCGIVCYNNGSFQVFYTADGTGVLASVPVALFSSITFPGEIFVMRLLFDLPATANGIQLAFQGANAAIVPPLVITLPPNVGAVPEPSTWAMLLIGFAGIGFAAYRRSGAGMRGHKTLRMVLR